MSIKTILTCSKKDWIYLGLSQLIVIIFIKILLILGNLTIFKDDNKERAGKAGVIAVIASGINQHINNALICRQGCGALCNIMIDCIIIYLKRNTFI